MPQCQIAGDATDLKKREHSVYVVGNFAARVMYVSCMKRIDATYEVCVAYSELIYYEKQRNCNHGQPFFHMAFACCVNVYTVSVHTSST